MSKTQLPEFEEYKALFGTIHGAFNRSVSRSILGFLLS
jgi:hypothetical protein